MDLRYKKHGRIMSFVAP